MKLNIPKILFKTTIITLIFISILSLGQYYLLNKIIATEQKYYNAALEELITNIKHDNNILKSKIIITDNKYLKLLGKTKPADMYVAKYNNTPTAVIVNATAPNGYNGNIELLIAIKLNYKSNSIISLKVLQHHETPGLGDLIEPGKSNFIMQYVGKHITNNINNNNKIDNIDSITGATITSNAVNNAAYNSLIFINNYFDLLSNQSTTANLFEAG